MNTVAPTDRWPPAEAQALEARFGLRVAAHLHESSACLPHDIAERLRVARQQAVARAQQTTRARAAAPVTRPQAQAGTTTLGPSTAGGLIAGGGDGDETWWMGLGILLLVLLLVSGLAGIDWWRTQEQIQAAAEVDAALLGDDLPPAAYADPGFSEFIVVHPLTEAPVLTGESP
ncbi:MAG: DUF3619 family protein [Burkholderiaceae bacterium]|nr:DUF3619 family protein [Burkholderiaceae bacterium]